MRRSIPHNDHQAAREDGTHVSTIRDVKPVLVLGDRAELGCAVAFSKDD